MDSRRALPVVVAAAIAAGAFALFLSRSGGRETPGGPAPERAASPATEAPPPAAAALATRDAEPVADAEDTEGADPRGSASIKGRVTTESGEPVPGVTVRAAPEGNAPGWALDPSGTDLQGRFRIALRGPGTYRVHARGAGWVTRGFSDATPRGHDPFAVVVERDRPTRRDLVVVRGAEATGLVTGPEGRPVVGAVVSARAVGERELGGLFGSFGALLGKTPVESSPTTSDGTYRLSTLVAGEDYDIYVTGGSMLPALLGPFRASLERPIRADFQVRPGRWIDVTVLSEDGKPIVDAKVVAHPKEPSDLDSLRGWDGWRWRTDAAGLARAGPFDAVDVEVDASADGYLGKHGTDARTERIVPPTESAVEFRLTRGGSVAGRVVDATGSPVAGVLVQALRRTVHPNGFRIEGFDAVRSGPDGTFRIEGLPLGTLTVRAGYGRSPPVDQASADVESGATGVVLTMGTHPEGRVVTLRILEPDGSPVPRATVRLGSYHSREALDGRLDLIRDDLVHGTEVRDPRDARGNPLPFGPVRIGTPKYDLDRVIEVRLVGGGSVAGRALGPDGAGVPNVSVALVVDLEEEEADEAVVAPLGTAAQTDETGAFRVDAVPEGVHSLRIEAPPDFVPPDAVVVEAGMADVEVRLRAGVRPWIRVVDAEGKPVAGAVVSADASDVSFPEALGRALGALFVGETRTDGEGRVRLETLDAAATHVLTVRPPSARPDLAKRTRIGWIPHDDTVALDAARTVAGTVRSPSGTPVPGARVVASAESTDSVEAGPDGHFEVKGLPPGRVELRAASPWGFVRQDILFLEPAKARPPPSGPPVVVESGARDVVLTLDPGETLDLRLLDPPADLEKRDVILVSERDPDVALKVAGSATGTGVAELAFRGLEPGERYALWVPASEESPLSLWHGGLRAGQATGDLRLRAGTTTRGRVSLPKGADDAFVMASRGAASQEAKVGADGAFEMSLPTGRWTFTALTWVGTHVMRSSVDAEAGAPVDLTIAAPPPAPR